MSFPLDRRAFLRRAAAYGGALLTSPSLRGLAACNGLPVGRRSPGYGPLAPSPDAPELWVPAGFRVARLSETGVPSTVNPSLTVPLAVDGMAAFPLPNGNVRLIRNHEVTTAAATARPIGAPERSYDVRAGGGTTSLEVRVHPDGRAELVAEFVSLSGTHVNCAGGPTPWGSWISCEETVAGTGQGYAQDHGYCFEVPAAATAEADPVPLKAMGRFVHEAVAVDPRTGTVYLTEDGRWSADPALDQPGAGFYRFLPRERGNLRAGGRLQMLAVADRPGYFTVTGQRPGAALPVEWVEVEDPDPPAAATDRSAVFRQGFAGGGAVFQRLEGCWPGDGSIYFDATSGGDAGAGQVWQYRPGEERLRLVFESPSREVLDSPDNICVSPRGGLVICEDGAAEQYLRGLTPEGEIFDLVRTAGPMSEFAGSCFGPGGRTLFFNRQGSRVPGGPEPGATYALWGPWERGAL